MKTHIDTEYPDRPGCLWMMIIAFLATMLMIITNLP